MSDHSEEYRRGYEDGIDSFRPKFDDIMAQINAAKSCIGCQYNTDELGEEPHPMCAKCSRYYQFDRYEPKDPR